MTYASLSTNAAARYINIIPEIEMPSHSEEVTATFPELSCNHKKSGQPDFCVGNEKTFEFLQNVLDEVIEIFQARQYTSEEMKHQNRHGKSVSYVANAWKKTILKMLTSCKATL